MRKLKIGQISPLNIAVPPKKYGGSERIIYSLCEGLTKKGHEVFLFGTGDSKVSCHLIPITKKGLWYSKISESSPYYGYLIAEALRKSKDLKLDILHDHLGPLSLPLSGQSEVPVIYTLHIPFKNKDRVFGYEKVNAKLVSISLAQRKPAPKLNYVANIYNGISLKDFPFNPKTKNYFCWAGELSPRKGIDEVLKIAKTAKINLTLAGRIPPPTQSEDYRFFKEYIEKALKKKNIKYLGELTQKGLAKLYKNAIAFLYPLQWEEPFGLTMIESMACGTPVIAFGRGSVPEIIEDKKTGFVVEPFNEYGEQNYKDFISAIKNIDKIRRIECRKLVEEKFTDEIMVNNYEKLYYGLALPNSKKI